MKAMSQVPLQESMSNLEMPRFTRRYPQLTDAVLRQMMAYAREFEEELLAQQQQQPQQQRAPPPPQQSGAAQDGDNQEGDPDSPEDAMPMSGGGEDSPDRADDQDLTPGDGEQQSVQARTPWLSRVHAHIHAFY